MAERVGFGTYPMIMAHKLTGLDIAVKPDLAKNATDHRPVLPAGKECLLGAQPSAGENGHTGLKPLLEDLESAASLDYERLRDAFPSQDHVEFGPSHFAAEYRARRGRDRAFRGGNLPGLAAASINIWRRAAPTRRRMAEWLRSCGVKTAAMQSTGVWPLEHLAFRPAQSQDAGWKPIGTAAHQHQRRSR